MSDLQTPETDTLILSKDGFGVTDYEWREHSRRLERERDEARSLTEHQWLLKVGSRLAVAGCKSDGIIDSLDEIIRERDKAREEADKWKKLHDTKDELFKKGIAEVERERDEARGAIKSTIAWLKLQLAYGKRVLPIGEKCEGWSDITGCPGHRIEEGAK